MKTVIKKLKELDYKFQSEIEPFEFTKTVQNVPGRDCTGHYSYTAPELWKWLKGKIFTPGKEITFDPVCRMEFCKQFREVNNLSFPEIGKIMGVSKQRAQQLYAQSYAPPEKRTKWSQFREEWKRLRAEGESIYRIAQKHNCSTSVVAGQLKKEE